jgi:hypothetical protein
LVHPNKGSNLVLLVECGGGPVFDVGTENRLGMIIFERIFPYAASMCMKAMIDFQPVFAMLGADDTPESQFAGALKKVGRASGRRDPRSLRARNAPTRRGDSSAPTICS